MNDNNILLCPVCRRKKGAEIALTPEENGKCWRCLERHSFDVASAGYLNLLPPSGSKTHGDNKEMIAARRALLDSGLYAPLREALTSLLVKKMPEGAVIWDSGCGEGYYTAEIAREGSAHSWRVYGSDLSKDALKNAARRSEELMLVAASSYALPAVTASCDALLCLFAPQAIDEFSRLLKSGGLLIQAVPGEKHLFGLKQAIYDSPYENKVNYLPPEGFAIDETVEIKYEVKLDDPQLIASLFQMTPYAYRTNREGQEKIARLNELATELDFRIFVYSKL